ncbi:bacteriocin-associated integral membrane family protein [Streptomyces indiaensis]|uniref:bacteriocin-associated integral membrane family protein n=1 Tax=Streptomyces indiaensis TaxID=284033 RepID=UPI001F2EBD09|nr:hypothetical protein [Streptomyces indiaensis]MCF1650280.1 hypothetical protein [Streptomyces indiaensis]
MLHRGTRFVHAAVLAFAAALSFLFVRGLDETGILGNTALVEVIDSDGSKNGAQVVRAVENIAAEYKVGVAREMPDMMNPDGLRHLYVTSVGTAMTERWLDEGYPQFSRNRATRVHPMSEVGALDPRGSYYVFGSAATVDALVGELDRLGLTTSVTHPLSYAELTARYSEDPLFQAFWVVALAAVTITGASVLLNAKTYGILRMQGMSFTGILLRDLRQLAFFWLAAAGTVTAVTLISLGLYNGFAWLGLFAVVAAVAAGLLLILVLTAHAAVLALTYKVDVLRALKGELPARAASLSVYAVRIPALLLALGIATNVTLAGRGVLMRLDNQKVYETVGEAVSIRLSGAFALRTEQLDRHVGPWLRQADRDGQVVLAGRRDLQTSAPGARLPSGEFLIVNDTYLAAQPVRDPAGRRYTAGAGHDAASDSRPIRVIIPDSLASHTAVITKTASRIMSSRQNKNVPLEALRGKTGQRLFGYNTGTYVYNSGHGPDEDRSMVRDPVLIVVPNGSRFLTHDAYTTYASQAGVIFPDPDDALSGIKANKLQSYISGISPVGQKTALDLRNAVSELRLHVFNLIVSALVLLIAGVGVCLIYSRRNAQAIFARHISGWRYVSTHRFILAVELAIAAIFATRVPFQAWQQEKELRQYAAAGAPTPFQPTHLTALDAGVITTLVAVEFGAVLLALAFFHRRIVKEGSAAA